MSAKSIFEFKSYRSFLTFLSTEKGRRSGVKSELAAAMDSHPAYLSRVLGGQADLSLEQAEKICRFLKFEFEEKKFFLLLLEEERASTKQLKQFFRQQLNEILQQRTVVQNRIPSSEEISGEDKATYYSSWHYSAIHVLVSIPRFQEVASIAGHLDLSPRTVQDALVFLNRIGLIKKETSGWSVSGRHIHVDRATKLFRQNHTNWHLRTLQSLDHDTDEPEVRYSGVFSLSKADAVLLREHLLKSLGEFLKQVSASPEETAYVYTCDFIPLGRQEVGPKSGIGV